MKNVRLRFAIALPLGVISVARRTVALSVVVGFGKGYKLVSVFVENELGVGDRCVTRMVSFEMVPFVTGLLPSSVYWRVFPGAPLRVTLVVSLKKPPLGVMLRAVLNCAVARSNPSASVSAKYCLFIVVHLRCFLQKYTVVYLTVSGCECDILEYIVCTGRMIINDAYIFQPMEKRLSTQKKKKPDHQEVGHVPREKVIAFLKKRKQALFTEIYQLGGDVPKIEIGMLNKVLDDLVNEGTVKESKFNRIRMFEWIEDDKQKTK